MHEVQVTKKNLQLFDSDNQIYHKKTIFIIYIYNFVHIKRLTIIFVFKRIM